MDENYLINWTRCFFKHEETVTKSDTTHGKSSLMSMREILRQIDRSEERLEITKISLEP
jgi:hypothetical protein